MLEEEFPFDERFIALLMEAMRSPEWKEMDTDTGFIHSERRAEKLQWNWEQTSQLVARQCKCRFDFSQSMRSFPEQYKLFQLLWSAQGQCERYRHYLYYKQGVKYGRQKQKKASAP